MKKSIVFITGHNYKAYRQGGFHKFAHAAANYGMDVVFFSYPRPLHILFKKDKPLEYKSLVKQMWSGIHFRVKDKILVNCAFANLLLPNKLLRKLPNRLVRCLHTAPRLLFLVFCARYFRNVKIFVIESNAGVMLFPFLKKKYPDAKFVYRPSDPMLGSNDLSMFHENEIEILKGADKNLLVNKEAIKLYGEHIPDFDKYISYDLLSNGVDVDEYQVVYERPEVMKQGNIALYIGARPIEWDLIVESANRLKGVNFVIICPENPSQEFVSASKEYRNITFIRGVSPIDVPRYVTNADLIIVPNPKEMYRSFPWGITAKYYQAMAAEKPIVAYHDNPELGELGVKVTYDTESFVREVYTNIDKRRVKYDFELEEKNWKIICDKFIDHINKLQV